MADDLIDRLRAYSEELQIVSGGGPPPRRYELVDEAAEKIQRLRERVGELENPIGPPIGE
jgi:hypothetical protein